MDLIIYILAALIAWGQPTTMPVVGTYGDTNSSWPDRSGVCTITIREDQLESWRAVLVAHEVGHCLLGRCGNWGHVADEVVGYSIMTASPLVYGLDRVGPTTWDLANLAAECRHHGSKAIIRLGYISADGL